MKRFTIFALVAVLLFSICACGKNDQSQELSIPEVLDEYEGLEDFTIDETKLPICSFGLQIYDGWIYYLERQSQWVGDSLRKCKLDLSDDTLVREDVEHMSAYGDYILCRSNENQRYFVILPDGKIHDLPPAVSGELTAADPYTVTLYGNKIFYARIPDDTDDKPTFDLYMTDLLENQTKKILKDVQNFAIRNGQVVFMRKGDKSGKLMSYTIESGEENELISAKNKDSYPSVSFGGHSTVMQISPQKASIVEFSDLSKTYEMDLAPNDNMGMSYMFITDETIYFNAIPAADDAEAGLDYSFFGYDRETEQLTAYEGMDQFDVVIYDGIVYYYDMNGQSLQSIDLNDAKVK